MAHQSENDLLQQQFELVQQQHFVDAHVLRCVIQQHRGRGAQNLVLGPSGLSLVHACVLVGNEELLRTVLVAIRDAGVGPALLHQGLSDTLHVLPLERVLSYDELVHGTPQSLFYWPTGCRVTAARRVAGAVPIRIWKDTSPLLLALQLQMYDCARLLLQSGSDVPPHVLAWAFSQGKGVSDKTEEEEEEEDEVFAEWPRRTHHAGALLFMSFGLGPCPWPSMATVSKEEWRESVSRFRHRLATLMDCLTFIKAGRDQRTWRKGPKVPGQHSLLSFYECTPFAQPLPAVVAVVVCAYIWGERRTDRCIRKLEKDRASRKSVLVNTLT